MDGVGGLDPLLGDDLGCEILRRIVADAVVLVHGQEAAAAPAAESGDVVEVVGAGSACAHHRADVVGEPEGAFDGAGAALAEVVAFGHEERSAGRKAVVFPRLDDVVYISGLPVEGVSTRAHFGLPWQG